MGRWKINEIKERGSVPTGQRNRCLPRPVEKAPHPPGRRTPRRCAVIMTEIFLINGFSIDSSHQDDASISISHRGSVTLASSVPSIPSPMLLLLSVLVISP